MTCYLTTREQMAGQQRKVRRCALLTLSLGAGLALLLLLLMRPRPAWTSAASLDQLAMQPPYL
jgi:hypothetical protein